MSADAPRTLADAVRLGSALPAGEDDRVAGFGVMGLPFASGHYLALRCFNASSFGPPYKSVWHRNPAGAWTIYSTVDASRGCSRYIGSDLSSPTVVCPIDVALLDDSSVRIYVEDHLDWTLTVTSNWATTLMSAVSARVPEAVWGNRWFLGVMGAMAGPLLSAGRLRLTGTMPNGQQFRTAPRQVWSIESSQAAVGGVDLGPVGPLSKQDRLGDFWLPQRGIFFADGIGRFAARGAR